MEYHKPYQTNLSLLDFGIFTENGEEFLVNNIQVTNNRAIHGDTVYVSNNEVVGMKKRTNNMIVGILHLNSNQK